MAELIDFPDHIVAHYERRPAGRSLWIEMTPDQCVGVLQTRGEHANAHLASSGRRQGSIDYPQPVGTAEACDFNNTIARLDHGLVPCFRHRQDVQVFP
jgi:hypothetical protein